jgi:hypothetical protein
MESAAAAEKPEPPERWRSPVPPATLLKVGYSLGAPGTLLSPWIMRSRNVPAFLGLMTGSALITTGWGLLRRWQHFGVNLVGFLGFLAWWRIKGR